MIIAIFSRFSPKRRGLVCGFLLSFVWALAPAGAFAADVPGEWFEPSPKWALQKLDWAKRTQPSTAWRLTVADGNAAEPLIGWAALTGEATWARVGWRLSREWNGGGETHEGSLARADAAEGLRLPAVPDGGWWLTLKSFGPDGGMLAMERFFLNVWDSPATASRAHRPDDSRRLKVTCSDGSLRVSGGDPAWRTEAGTTLRLTVREFDGALVRREVIPAGKTDAAARASWEIPVPEATPGRALRVIVEIARNERIVDGEELWVATPGDSSPAPDWGEIGDAPAPSLAGIFLGETAGSYASFESQREGLDIQIEGMRARGGGAVQLWIQWGRVEIMPGAYDWSNLDAYVAYLTEKRVPFTLGGSGSVLFGNGPFTTWGDWMLNHKGEFKLWRTLPVISPASPGWQKDAREFTRRLIERYRGNPYLVGYAFLGQGMDSGIFTDHYDSVTDYSPVARADFLRFLKKRYSSTLALNAAWGTAWKRWREVRAPLPRLDQEVNLSRAWQDWTHWKLEVYRKSTAGVFDPVVEELDPRRAVVHYTVKTGPFEHLLKDVKLRSYFMADGAGEDHRMDRSNGITRNWGLLRQTESHDVPPANIRFMQDMVSQTLRGEADHIRFNLVWNSRPAVFRDQYPKNEALRTTLRWWADSAELRERLSRARPPHAELGVVVSWADLLHRQRAWRWYAMAGNRADKLVRSSGFLPVRWLSEWAPDRAWQDLRTVLVPEDALIWDPRLKARLDTFVRKGGELVVWGRGGQYAVEGGEAGAPFAWAEHLGAGNLRPSAVANSTGRPKSALTLNGREYEVRPAVIFGADPGDDGAVKVARDALGRPVVMEWIQGKGRVRWCVSDEPGASDALVAGLIEASGVARRVVSSAPGIEGIVRGEGDRRFLVLSRFMGFSRDKIAMDPLEASIAVPGLPGEWSVTRVLSQSADDATAIPTWEEFRNGSAKVFLLPSEMQVFELVRKPADGRAAGAAEASGDPLTGLRDPGASRVLRELTERLDASAGPISASTVPRHRE